VSGLLLVQSGNIICVTKSVSKTTKLNRGKILYGLILKNLFQ